MAPEIGDAGPTRLHNGNGVFSHIELKSPNPMMPVDEVVERCDNKHSEVDFPLRWAVTKRRTGRLSPQRRGWWNGGEESC